MPLICTACGFSPVLPEQEPPPSPTGEIVVPKFETCPHCGAEGTVVEVEDEDDDEE